MQDVDRQFQHANKGYARALSFSARASHGVAAIGGVEGALPVPRVLTFSIYVVVSTVLSNFDTQRISFRRGHAMGRSRANKNME